jgi:ribosomal protein S1
MSWLKKIDNPADILKKGDVVEVKVLSVDPASQRIALGMKQLQPDPWEGVAERFIVGTSITGKITKIAPFGAFVELEPGVEGLVHSSQYNEGSLHEGDEVTATIMNVSQEERKIGLNLK